MESGSHDQLMTQQDSHYRRLVQAQELAAHDEHDKPKLQAPTAETEITTEQDVDVDDEDDEDRCEYCM